jgi:hypothetical protein
LIYHIDESSSDSDGSLIINSDNEGHPWQSDGFPTNGRHYSVALLQADRLYSLERGINRGGKNDFFNADYIDNLMPSLDLNEPLNGPFPNTDSYQHGVVKQTGVEIHDVSVAGGSTMSFMFRSAETPTLTMYAENEEQKDQDEEQEMSNIPGVDVTNDKNDSYIRNKYDSMNMMVAANNNNKYYKNEDDLNNTDTTTTTATTTTEDNNNNKNGSSNFARSHKTSTYLLP